MPFGSKQFIRAITATTLVSIFAVPNSVFSQEAEHLVSPSQMQQAVVDASQARQQNQDTLDKFFSSEKARQALQASHMNADQVKAGIASLNDTELAQLASRAHKAQSDFAAGNMNDHDLLIILIAIAALILIIIAVR